MTIRILYVGPDIPEDASPAVREGLARRNITMRTGACPCGATFALNRAMRRAMRRGAHHVTIEHEDGCAAIAPETEAWLRGMR